MTSTVTTHCDGCSESASGYHPSGWSEFLYRPNGVFSEVKVHFCPRCTVSAVRNLLDLDFHGPNAEGKSIKLRTLVLP